MKGNGIQKVLFVAFFLALGAGFAAAQDLKSRIKELYPIPSSTGNEEALAAKIEQSLPKNGVKEKDAMGSLFARWGKGEPRLAVLTALDEIGYIVSGITSDGYLRLDRAVQPPHPLFDSYLLGHPVMISTQKGLLQGIISQPAMHFLTRERREELSKNFSLDFVYLDVGVRSEEEARAKGIEILDPVTFWPDLSQLANDRWAGHALGLKTGCAVLLNVAAELGGMKLSQEVVLGWMAQTKFPARGTRSALGAMRAKNKFQPQNVLILDIVAADRGEKSPVFGKGPVLVQAKEGTSKLKDIVQAIAREKNIPLQSVTGTESTLMTPFLGDSTEALILALPVKFPQTPVEVVDFKDVQALEDLILGVLGSGRAR
jgi:putative aminopeptidase FrvX